MQEKVEIQLNKGMIRKEMLRRPYIHVEQEDGSLSYGGDQAWLSTAEERSFGCGLIAAADILRYLRAQAVEENMGRETDRETNRDTNRDMDRDTDREMGREMNRDTARDMPRKISMVTRQEYLEDIRILSRDFRIRGPLGITGFGLARRMNRIFRREQLPFRSKWSIGRKRLEKRLLEMLSEDIPVLLSVGPGFFHRKERLPMYRPAEEQEGKGKNRESGGPEGHRDFTGGFTKANSMHDHYVTVTGYLETGGAFPGRWLRISSWGGEYYVNHEEYMEHVRKYDNFLFSSLLYIRKKNRGSE